jgi:anti-sigma regulatory factor (Ser/Thr protein kinase)
LITGDDVRRECPSGCATNPWPLSSSLALGALPTATPCARLHARVVLDEWGLSTIAETAELIVSELVTNAVAISARHGDEPGIPVVYLRLGTDHLRLMIEVWDSDPGTPVAKQAGPDDESGRGLMLVEALCDRWHWTTVPGWRGKYVFAEIPVH